MINKMQELVEDGASVQQGLPDVYDLVNSNANLSKPSYDTKANTGTLPGTDPKAVDPSQEMAPDVTDDGEDVQFQDSLEKFKLEFDSRVRALISRLADAQGFSNSVDVVNKIMADVTPIVKKHVKKFE